jgi:hypothetical protein
MISPYGMGSVLKPFVTDYCTNFAEGTKKEPNKWKECCLYHDLYFWAGGTISDRKNADLVLRNCIEKTGAHKIAEVMYLGVRLGSYSPIKYSDKKWSNGWSNRESFKALSIEDITRIEEELNSGYDYIKDKKGFIDSLKDRKY